MLAAVRHGANEVFKAKDVGVSDEDIDVILSKAEARVSTHTRMPVLVRAPLAVFC